MRRYTERTLLLERITEPERVIMFRVPWVDDNGRFRLTVASVYSSTVLSDLTREVLVFILQ